MLCVDSIVKALQEHHAQQTSERKKLYKHRKKWYDNTNKYLGLIIAGMDQKKTLLPHFVRTPKNLQEENFYPISVGRLRGPQWENVVNSLLHSSKYS